MSHLHKYVIDALKERISAGENLKATVQHVRQRSWRWGKRAEIRIHTSGVAPIGRGYTTRCLYVITDIDTRNCGPRSNYGWTLDTLRSIGVSV